MDEDFELRKCPHYYDPLGEQAAVSFDDPPVELYVVEVVNAGWAWELSALRYNRNKHLWETMWLPLNFDGTQVPQEVLQVTGQADLAIFSEAWTRVTNLALFLRGISQDDLPQAKLMHTRDAMEWVEWVAKLPAQTQISTGWVENGAVRWYTRDEFVALIGNDPRWQAWTPYWIYYEEEEDEG